MEVLIRPFRPVDLDGLFVLDYRCYAPAYRFGYQQLLRTLQQSEITALIIQGEREGDVVGGLIVRDDTAARRLAIVSLMVDEAFRRVGLASRLLEWAVRRARRDRREAVTVPLERGNEGAAAFLTARGFADTEQAQPFFPSSEVGTLWQLPIEAPLADAP